MLNFDETDDKKWTGLQWAVVNGHLETVRILLKKRKEIQEREGEPVEKELSKEEEIQDYKKNEFDDIFKKPPNSSYLGKYNPLHWAAYKGFTQIASILIKHGFDPLEIDSVGNTSIHQAAASNKPELFKIFIGLGLDLEIKNDREHQAIDLTADKSIKNLIIKTLSIKNCQMCPKPFDFFNKRFVCSIGEEVICKNCCVSDFYFENVNSKEKDILECRCKTCYNQIQDTENMLRSSIKSNNLEEITKVFSHIKNKSIKVCCKLSNEAETNINRLEREKKIHAHLNSLKFVENHKTIEKSVYLLEQMIQEAKDSKIELDVVVIDKCMIEKNRLLAEKELRKMLSNLTVDLSSHDNLQDLEQKLNTASKYYVEEKYIKEAEELRNKIRLNLTAKELLELFTAYPIREYPVVEVIDPKKKAKPEPPKKKKKKEAPFIVPEWAKELKVLIDKVQELKGYVGMSLEIGLEDNFLHLSKEQLARFNQEITFRKNEEETLRKLEEEKKKKGKKK
jgi:hypothetical protein